jgi:hypothetical protein
MDPRTIKQKRDHYLQEIARRASPCNHQDEFKRDVYQGLLDSIDWVLMFGGSLMTTVPAQICNSDVKSRRSVIRKAGQMGHLKGGGDVKTENHSDQREPSEYAQAKQSDSRSE